MADNERFDRDPGLIYRDRTDQLDDNDGMRNRNVLVRIFYHMIWSVKAYFNTIFAHSGDKDEATMNRADEDFEIAHERYDGAVEDSTKNLLAKENAKATDAVIKFVEKRNINVDHFISADNFSDVAKVLAEGSDEKKKNSFRNLVYERINSLNQAHESFSNAQNNPEAIYNYYKQLEETELSLQEYLDTHNAYGRDGKNREEFVNAILPMIAGKRNAFADEHEEVIKTQRDFEKSAKIATVNKVEEYENIKAFAEYESELSDGEDSIDEANLGMREKDDSFSLEVKERNDIGKSQKQNAKEGMTEKIFQ